MSATITIELTTHTHTHTKSKSKKKEKNIEREKFTIIQFGLPMAHKLILASSPPVTMTRPDFWPNDKHVTADPWATNSSARAYEEKNGKN